MYTGRRVVITGAGAVTPLGCDVSSFWESLCAGRSGVGPITRFDCTQYSTRIAAEVEGWDPDKLFSPKDRRRLDLFSQYAIGAADEAVASSGVLEEGFDPCRAGAVIGSGIGGISTTEYEKIRLIERGPKRVSPFCVPMEILNMASAHVAIRHGLEGPNFAVVSACASGAHSIGTAYRMVACGEADVMFAGGSEASITPLSFAGFGAARTLSTRNDEPERASRPFDRDRDGFVMGEGAAVLVLEEIEHARRRNAPIIAEIVGYGATCDAYHITAPAPGGAGAARAMKLAIDSAGVSLDNIDYINAHGTSTVANDREETAAIKTVFGNHAKQLSVSSNKSMIGHTLGAAGAIEFLATALTVQTGIIPPTINLDNPDDGCDLDYVPHTAVERPVEIAMSNSLGFGGHNACLIVKRFEG
ncbi:MAG: beta-ketoacyl-ACP synthase II [Candidatus Hydrogenedentes bacterium]|nr:beta-ketoacyl-ACP synthase II [Candidatus Hydrogenedentota bacterium]